jgi:hypothetical protein
MKSSLQDPKVIAKQQPPEPLAVSLEQKIRDRAYELYEQRGRGDGHAVEDWVQAESELTTDVKAA